MQFVSSTLVYRSARSPAETPHAVDSPLDGAVKSVRWYQLLCCIEAVIVTSSRLPVRYWKMLDISPVYGTIGGSIGGFVVSKHSLDN